MLAEDERSKVHAAMDTPLSTGRLTARDRLLLTIVSLVVLVPGTFGVSLTDRDEGWYAQVSREMLEDEHWLIPHYLGEPWIAKPPLLNWCVAASFAAFGTGAFAARLVSVLAMLGAAHLLATLMAELGSRRAALIASISFVTAGLPAIVGKLVLTDALLLFWCVSASLLLWRIANSGASVTRCVGFWVCVGAGLLTKGPAIILAVGPLGLGLLALRGWKRWLLNPKLWLTSPLCLVVALPWYLYVARHAGPTLWGQFVGYEIVSRLVSTPHGHGGCPGYYVIVSLAGWLPWTVLVPGAVLETWAARRTERVAWVLLLWCGVPWLLLELIPSKLPHYILPCYVPLAVMLGRMWDTGLERTASNGQRAVLGLWVGVGVALGAALVVAAIHWRGLAWALSAGVAGSVMVAGFVIVGVFVKRRRWRASWTTAVATTCAFHALAGLWVLPQFEPYRLSRRIAEQANALDDGAASIYVSGYTEPTMFFYLERPARVLASGELAGALRDRSGSCIVIARDENLRAAGVKPADHADWRSVEGVNYVKGCQETVWVGRLPANVPPE